MYHLDELERLIVAYKICQHGLCSQCTYKENCMDGLIDDGLEFFIKLHNSGQHYHLETGKDIQEPREKIDESYSVGT